LEVSQLFLGIRTQTQNFVDKEQLLISGMRGQVRALSPKLTLERGYAVVRNLDGGVITDPKSAAKGQKLRVTLSKGDLGVTAD
jgi:exodeoxyribonuclease VII large subunit